ncbi:prolipoprotein diacylglyceryl transferase [Bacillus methanolicus]|uniref:prolipoprotein diacylglyceryl transferase n=1 Tax=Bacillus methanolicus TaxID=1471 RepID=UPI00200D5B00|nr:prolipoprotein diacylglyceryl transferase [Bacillus methanolicus]UQD50983.1 prolipoprotein diacylglyceryl transferase [Bacillus methanolicus]
MNENPTPINPIAFELGPISVHWYGIIIGLGALLGLYLAIQECKKRGISPDILVDLVTFALPIAIISARAYYVLFEWNYYKNHLSEIPAIWNGGIAIHGGLIGAVVTAIIFTRIKKVSFWKLADITAPSILLGQAIGRWGNFINQEAHGGPVSKKFLERLHIPTFIIDQMNINGIYYHPTFLYESLWSLIGVVLLISLRKINLRRGELFLTYLIWYSIGRFYIEGMRTDSLMLTAYLRIAQVISIVIIAGSASLIIFRRIKGLSSKRYLTD